MDNTSTVSSIEYNTKTHSLRARSACRKAKSRRIEMDRDGRPQQGGWPQLLRERRRTGVRLIKQGQAYDTTSVRVRLLHKVAQVVARQGPEQHQSKKALATRHQRKKKALTTRHQRKRKALTTRHRAKPNTKTRVHDNRMATCLNSHTFT